MGKKKGRKRQLEDDDDSFLLAAAAAFADAPSASPVALPLTSTSIVPFPSHLPKPQSGFLTNTDPEFQEPFQAALNTCYHGFVWDEPETFDQRKLQRALKALDRAGFFRVDATQPAGLGSKLAPTHVTRCLVGDAGMTYRYLGLRMFAYPWNDNRKHPVSTATKSREAVQTVYELNQQLSARTLSHVETLNKQQQQQVKGKTSYNVALINRMHAVRNWEPMYRTLKCAVSWHADSSLEHFSSIAVYQIMMNSEKKQKQTKHSTTSPPNTTNNHHTAWSIALRVAQNAEGPKAKPLADIKVDTNCPPLSVQLPSGAAYYMLGDFNHHHQHAVVANSAGSAATTGSSLSGDTIRFSSTHRVLRKAANVQSMIDRCQLAFTKRGRWKADQLLLSELESEWLRQFYVQGADHKELLWDSYWKEPMEILFAYWSRLEMKTYQVAVWLKVAAQKQCGMNVSNEADAKREEIIGKDSTESVYSAFAKCLEDRAKMRHLWGKREQDPAFRRLSEGCRPIPFPVQGPTGFEPLADDTSLGRSPMPVAPEFLTNLASDVLLWEKCFESKRAQDFPGTDALVRCVCASAVSL
jgi:alpha-ketoglutarate-dependent dioxygenase FTO